jgi:hypothetical protein
MVVVASAEIQVDLMDAEYRRKKQAIATDYQELQRPILLAFDVDRAVGGMVQFKNYLDDRKKQVGELGQAVGGFVAPVPTLANYAAPKLDQYFIDERKRDQADHARRVEELIDPQILAEEAVAKRKQEAASQSTVSKHDQRIANLPGAPLPSQKRSAESASERQNYTFEYYEAKRQAELEKSRLKEVELEKKKLKEIEREIKAAIAEVHRQEQQRTKDYAAEIQIVTDIRRRDIQSQLGQEIGLQAELTRLSRTANLDRQRLKRTASETNQDASTTIDFAKAQLSQSSELQNLSKLSQKPQNALTQQEIERQVKELSGGKNLGELRLPGLSADQSLLVRRQQQEDVLAKAQAAALSAQLSQKQAGLELELKSEKIANARVVQEQKLALLKAQQNQLNAAQAYGDANFAVNNPAFDATERDKAIARNKLANAGSNLNLATQGVAIANQGVIDAKSNQNEFSGSVVATLKAQLRQDSASKELFNLSYAARERQQSLELAQSGIDPSRYNNRRYEPFDVSDAGAPSLDGRTNPTRGERRPELTVDQKNQLLGPYLERLVTVNERMFTQNAQMLYEIQQLVIKLPIKPQSIAPAPQSPVPILRGRGL